MLEIYITYSSSIHLSMCTEADSIFLLLWIVLV
jgi:hypothetical protein